MKLRFLTENGTWYKILWDDARHTGTWEKISTTTRSGSTRHNGGTLIEAPKVSMGAPVTLTDTSILPGCVAHSVLTSHVVAIQKLS